MEPCLEQNRQCFVSNPHLANNKAAELYHLGLNTKDFNPVEMFSDVKFVCLGGSTDRMKQFAELLVKELPYNFPLGQTLCDIAGASDRYVLYKVGPVLTASHGIGIPSLSIVLNELFKLLHLSQCKDVTFIRIGTSGGLDISPGTVVVSESFLNGQLQPHLTRTVLGQMKTYSALVPKNLVDELVDYGHPEDKFKTIGGVTLCTDDFYEGQGRLDGAFCDYTEEEKMDFLRSLLGHGVRNIEMEFMGFAAMCHSANVKAAVVCVAILDRMRGDKITATSETLKEWIHGPETIVLRYIKEQLHV